MDTILQSFVMHSRLIIVIMILITMIITTYHKSRPLDNEHITGSTDTAPSLNAMFKRLFQGGPVSGEDSLVDKLARHGCGKLEGF